MTFDFNTASPLFKDFYEAFSPLTYGKSMGRAADHGVYMYDRLTDDEKAVAVEWFLELFAQEKSHWGYPYIDVIERMNDPRFIPLLEAYCRRLKASHKRPIRAELNGEVVVIRPSFRSEIQRCKKAIRMLKRRAA